MQTITEKADPDAKLNDLKIILGNKRANGIQEKGLTSFSILSHELRIYESSI